MEWAWVVAVVMIVAIVVAAVFVLRRNTADDRRLPDKPARERRRYPTGWNRSTGEMRMPPDEGDPPAPRRDA
ncbi:hypothetical protein ABZ249_01365 [Nocardiopsis sp. NPDC006139]|uniref:hypothetical protein n=1 Tax=Nocardiopsis TaxID=2013 RepID=UPI0033BFA4C5